MLMKARECCLLVVDVQERLLPAIAEKERVANRCEVLMRAAQRLSVPILVSEQYPKGIGHTIAPLKALVPPDAIVEKMHFSCGEDPAFVEKLASVRRPQVVVAGIEAHVCVLQTVVRLKELGYDVFVVADGCSSRDLRNAEAALRRMDANGAEIVTSEMVLFEWLHCAGTPEFKDVMPLIK